MGSFYSPEDKGLVDAESGEDFDEMLLKLGPLWDKRKAEFSTMKPSLYGWFCQYHAKEVRSSMIAPIRESAGLRNPPQHFTTNCQIFSALIHY